MTIDRRNLVFAGIAGVLAVLPAFLNAYWVDVLNSIGIYAILALSLNLMAQHLLNYLRRLPEDMMRVAQFLGQG